MQPDSVRVFFFQRAQAADNSVISISFLGTATGFGLQRTGLTVPNHALVNGRSVYPCHHLWLQSTLVCDSVARGVSRRKRFQLSHVNPATIVCRCTTIAGNVKIACQDIPLSGIAHDGPITSLDFMSQVSEITGYLWIEVRLLDPLQSVHCDALRTLVYWHECSQRQRFRDSKYSSNSVHKVSIPRI